MRRRVLLVVDHSACVRRAVIVTAALAADWDAEVIVCRARTKRPSRGGAIASEPLDRARQSVDEAADALARLGVTVADRLVVTSRVTAAEAILHAGFERAVSMIVVPTPGRASLPDWSSSRVARRLSERSDIPVLVVGAGQASSRPLVHRRTRAPRRPVDERA